MITYNTLIISNKNKNIKVKFGIPDSEEELIKMFKLRYEIYSQKNYIDPNQFPDKLERDEYDKNNKAIYFIASVNNEVIGTLRLIKDYPLPTQLYFEFEEPEEIKQIKKQNLVEIGRLIVKPYKLNTKKYLPRHLIMLGLFKTICDYSHKYNFLAGYAFIKSSLEKKLKFINFPVEYIQQYKQKYPEDGILFRYFNNPTDPVIPVYFLRDSIEKFLNTIFNWKFFNYTGKNIILFKDTYWNRLFLKFKLKFFTKKFSNKCL